MFKKENYSENFKEAETVIGQSIKVKGDFNGSGNIVIDGFLEGSLKTKGNVLVGESSKISANIEAKEAFINGEIKGNLTIEEYLSVGSTAKIFGDIKCSHISIDRGAIINGKIITGVNTSTKDESTDENNQEQA